MLGLSLAFVFLILAALCESWSLPFSVLLSTPVAGAAARRVMGTVVVSGMLAATLLGIFFIPALFVAVERLRARRAPAEGSVTELPTGSPAE